MQFGQSWADLPAPVHLYIGSIVGGEKTAEGEVLSIRWVACQGGPRHLQVVAAIVAEIDSRCPVLSSVCLHAGCYTQTVHNADSIPDDLKQYSKLVQSGGDNLY